MKWTKELFNVVEEMYEEHSWEEISDFLEDHHDFSKTPNAVRKAYNRYMENPEILDENQGPKVLLFDIETFPLEVYTWSLWQDSIPLNMVKEDWSVLGWCAKWYGEDEIFYADVNGQKNLRDDKKILKELWHLLDEADYVVGHNSDQFDVKKINARFILHGMQPPSSFKKLDTKKLAKKYFGFTSNKLAYLTDKLCKRYKKLSHGNFPGFSMWKACLDNNQDAFAELKEYNTYDVLSLEELFGLMLPWESSVLFQTYGFQDQTICTCGSQKFRKSGFHHTQTGKFQKYRCKQCGSEYRDRENLIDSDSRKALKGRTSR